jgi:predicted  nucleic acid-binding Zn-ribbon protein
MPSLQEVQIFEHKITSLFNISVDKIGRLNEVIDMYNPTVLELQERIDILESEKEDVERELGDKIIEITNLEEKVVSLESEIFKLNNNPSNGD